MSSWGSHLQTPCVPFSMRKPPPACARAHGTWCSNGVLLLEPWVPPPHECLGVWVSRCGWRAMVCAGYRWRYPVALSCGAIVWLPWHPGMVSWNLHTWLHTRCAGVLPRAGELTSARCVACPANWWTSGTRTKTPSIRRRATSGTRWAMSCLGPLCCSMPPPTRGRALQR